MIPTKAVFWYEAAAAVAVAIAIYFAFKIVGFLGVGILGVLIMFIAFQADLSKDGGSTAYSIIPRPMHHMSHAEKSARRADAASLDHPILVGKLLGLCLAAIGFGTLYFFGA